MWDWAWKANSLNLKEVARFVGIDGEGGNAYLDSGYRVHGHDGVEFDPDAPLGPKHFGLIVRLRWTNKDGQVVHSDGEPGHLMENLHKVQLELQRPNATLTRTRPHVGTELAPVKLVGDPVMDPSDRASYVFPLMNPEGSWRSSTETTASGTPPTFVTGGNRRIPDPVLILSAAGTFTYTTTSGRVYTIVGLAGPTYPVTIDVGAQTIVDNAAQDATGFVTFSHLPWLMLDPGSTLSLSSDVSVTLKARSRWA